MRDLLIGLFRAERTGASISEIGNRRDRLIGWLILAAGVLLALGCTLPFFRVKRFFIFSDDVALAGAVVDLVREGEWLIGALVALLSIVFPLLKLQVAFRLWRRVSVGSSVMRRSLGLLDAIAKWSMADVFVVAVLIVSAKASGIADAVSRPGLYCFLGGVALSIVAVERIKGAARRLDPPSEGGSPPGSSA